MKSEPAISNRRIKTPLAALLKKGLDFVLPPLCFGCRGAVETQGGLCSTCWSSLKFITRPHCDACGYPFPHEMPKGMLCAACHQKRPAYDMALAALAYDPASRPLVLSFKHGERTEGLKTMARWMNTAGEALLDDSSLIVPVPLHPRRLWRRRYNQSALLARALGEVSGKAVDVLALTRKKNTPSQGGLNRYQRRRNVRAAFRVPDSHAGAVRDQNIVLVDDVLTTGATAENCARALKKAGAGKIYVLTLARVVEPMSKL